MERQTDRCTHVRTHTHEARSSRALRSVWREKSFSEQVLFVNHNRWEHGEGGAVQGITFLLGPLMELILRAKREAEFGVMR